MCVCKCVYVENHPSCVAYVERGGKSTREGAKNDVGRRERRKRGRGMKERDERSKGTEIRIPDTFAMIKPTAPFKLAKHTTLRKRN